MSLFYCLREFDTDDLMNVELLMKDYSDLSE